MNLKEVMVHSKNFRERWSTRLIEELSQFHKVSKTNARIRTEFGSRYVMYKSYNDMLMGPVNNLADDGDFPWPAWAVKKG